MSISTSRRSFMGAVATVIVAAARCCSRTWQLRAPDGTIKLTLYKAGFIVGGSGGEGTLTFKGKQYPVVSAVSARARTSACKRQKLAARSTT